MIDEDMDIDMETVVKREEAPVSSKPVRAREII